MGFLLPGELVLLHDNVVCDMSEGLRLPLKWVCFSFVLNTFGVGFLASYFKKNNNDNKSNENQTRLS